MTDLTRLNDSFQKKSICIMVAPIVEGSDDNEVPAANGNHLLALLPPDAYVTDAYVFVETVSDAATSLTAKLGTASGGGQILTSATLKTAGKRGTFVPGVETKTGIEVWLNLAYVGAATAVGEYRVVVEYLEFTKDTGEYTNFTK